MISTVSKLLRPAGLSALVVFALVKISTQPVVAGRPVAIVFAPWVGSAEAISRATVGARLLARGGMRFAVTVVPDSADYATTLNGAWLVTGLPDQPGCAAANRARGATRS